MKMLRPIFIFCSIILIMGLACSLPGGTKGSPTQPSKDKPTAESNALPTKSSEGNGVGTLSDAQNAVIQIESQGTFIDPQVGLVVNGAGRGSGFIIDPSGIAVTNNHVVTGSALLKVWVNGVQHNAQILGVSECSDLAVIKIDGGGPYPFLNWYSGDIKTGLEVYAAGFPLGEPQYSLTKGIISKEKADGQTSWASLDYVLGHDATINPGNSGGPLITADGQVVGINYSTLKSANQYFAIDEKTARPVVDQLMKGKDIDSIGINGTAVRSDDGKFSGIWVSSVKSGSPADKSGIKAGDILYQMENLVLATDGTMKDYCSILRTHKPDDTLALSVIRFADGELLEGQLNGRELTVKSKFDVSGSSSGNNNSNSSGSSGDGFFIEQFDQDPGNTWALSVLGPGANDNADKVTYSFDSSHMIFNIAAKDLYAYYMFTGYSYDNVYVGMRFENRGVNSQNVGLVCRASDEGWYEFSVGSDGLWYLYAHTPNGGYETIKNGGSKAVKTGKAVNEYGMSCNGDKIGLFINGSEVSGSPFTDKTYAFRKGTVGFNVSSLKSIPVKVEVDAFQISQP